MVKFESSPSHSWWWNGHRSPKNSRWLQSNLQDVDEKVKEMLKLIEEDADSFAQRAEMYYQKRPELVKLVEEFYRAYRALAERYDHLTGEIKQNVPRALQVQYGLSSCDSPQSPVVGTPRYICSPLRKGQALDISLTKACQSEEQVQSEVQKDETDDSCEHKENDLLPDEELPSSSDSEVENSAALHKLQEEMWSLREQNSSLTDDHKKILECNSTMQIEIGRLREDHATFEEEIVNKVNELNRDLSILQMENNKQVQELLTDNMLTEEFKETCFCLQEKCDALDNGSPGIECCNDSNKDIDEVTCDRDMLRESVVKEKIRILEEKVLKLTKDYRSLVAALRVRVESQRTATTALRFLRAGVFGLVEKNRKLREDLSAKIEDEIQNKATKELSKENAKRIVTLEEKIEDLQGQMVHVAEENRIQKLVILDRGEEKREAIRQLCFSIDILKNQNQRLELVLGRMRKRFLSSHNSVADFNVPLWRKILLGVWKGSKAQPYALAH